MFVEVYSLALPHKVKALFRYSGNKGRMLRYYRRPPSSTVRVVEPYLGSGAYMLNQSARGLGFDSNPFVTDLWQWLQQVKPEDLKVLAEKVDQARLTEPKPDIRTMGLSRGEMLYLKVNVCSLVVGQWSSWNIYPQHKLPLGKTTAALPRTRDVEVRNADAASYEPEEGDTLFLDPPYVGTAGNYLNEAVYKPQNTLDLLRKADGIPTIFTHGAGAATIFPGLPWEAAATRNVPNFRNGGVIRRTEYVAYLNWPTV